MRYEDENPGEWQVDPKTGERYRMIGRIKEYELISVYRLADKPNAVADTTKVFRSPLSVKPTRKKPCRWAQ